MTISKITAGRPGIKLLFAHPAHFFALGFGAGLSPWAPGTLGTLVGLPVFWLLSLMPALFFWLVLILLFVVGVWICGRTGRALGVSDHGGIVWDEIVAFVMVLAFTPATFLWISAAFLLFRLFDIWKPFPIGYFDRRLKGGFGVMLDDFLAAGYAILLILVAQKLLSPAGT